MADESFYIDMDNSGLVLSELSNQIEAALEAVGNQAVSHAKQNVTKGVPRNADSWYTPKGALRNSINHVVNGDTCYVGTNLEYAIYNEYGTGIYAEGGKGRHSPWVYRSKDGTYHKTRGMIPLHFLKNAMQDNLEQYKKIIEQHLK